MTEIQNLVCKYLPSQLPRAQIQGHCKDAYRIATAHNGAHQSFHHILSNFDPCSNGGVAGH